MERPDLLMQYTEIIGDFPENDKIINSLCTNNIRAGKPDYNILTPTVCLWHCSSMAYGGFPYAILMYVLMK